MPHNVLKLIGWIELATSAPLLYRLIGFIRAVYWPEDPTPWHGEFASVGLSISAVLFALFVLPALAAIYSWPRAWWWQLLAVLGLGFMDYMVVSYFN